MATENRYIDLSGRVAIVTGAGNGIGRGIAHRLAGAKASIVVADIDLDAASGVAKELTALGVQAEAVEVDVTSQESTDAMVAAALDAFGRVDILVNNAGVGGAPGWTERETGSIEDWSAVFEVNVLGIVHSSKSVSAHMKERRSGKIVNIASIAGRRGSPGFAHYSTSKASAINVSQAFAHELAPHGVNVNSVCPGLLWTDLFDGIAQRQLRRDGDSTTTGREFFEGRVSTAAIKREVTLEDVGNAVTFLASDRAGSITGQSLNVDGGIAVN